MLVYSLYAFLLEQHTPHCQSAKCSYCLWCGSMVGLLVGHMGELWPNGWMDLDVT